MTPNCCAVKSMVFKTSDSAPRHPDSESLCVSSREAIFPQNSPKWFASNFVGHVFESRRRRSAKPLREATGAMNSKIPVTAPSSPLMKWTSRETSHTATLCKRFFGLFVCNAETLRIRFDEHAAPSRANSNRCEFENRRPAPSSNTCLPQTFEVRVDEISILTIL